MGGWLGDKMCDIYTQRFKHRHVRMGGYGGSSPHPPPPPFGSDFFFFFFWGGLSDRLVMYDWVPLLCVWILTPKF